MNSMKRIFTLIIISMTFFNILFALPPSNDECSGAIELNQKLYDDSDFSFRGCNSGDAASTVGATASAQMYSCAGGEKDIWFKFTAQSYGAIMNICDVVSSIPSASVSLYESSCSGTEVFCAAALNFSGGKTSVTLRNLKPGTTYYMRICLITYTIGGTTEDDFNLVFFYYEIPTNDNSSNATLLSPRGPGQCDLFSNNTFGASASSESQCGSTLNYPDIWYKFVAIGRRYNLSLIYSFSTVFEDQVFESPSGNSNSKTSIYCFQARQSNGTHPLSIKTIPGYTYYIRLTSLVNREYVRGSLCQADNPPTNDELSNAITPTLVPTTAANNVGYFSVNTINATKSSQSTTCGGGSQDDDVWYRIVLPVNATVNVDYLDDGTFNWDNSSGISLGMQRFFDFGGSITSVDNNGGCLQSFTSGRALALSAGTNYLRIYNTSDNNGDDFKLRIRAPMSVLPIELLSFQAQNTEGSNKLTWQTATETNTSHFDIERSPDGKTFEKIGEVKAKGSNSVYQYVDKTGAFSTIYYRLKINDLDGKSDYSKVVNLTAKVKGFAAKVYPNPLKDQATIEITSEQKADVTIELYDMIGRQVKRLKAENTEGVVTMPFDMKDLSNGTYFLKISNNTNVIQQKIVKQE
jgi:Secretion system C-terminal sorting domain